ncbi:MAG TPA: hypothetical protein VLA13_05715 [Massilibacterium sp.]|nr:hypothetical protein [Massilibacterium sp.]
MANKVIANFKDKFTKKIYKKGDSYTHADEKRIAFLVKKGFLEENKEDKPKKKSAKKADKK